MRIAMYSDGFYPYSGGISTAVSVLAQALAEKGHHIFVQAPKPKDTPDLSTFHPNITINYVSSVEIFFYPDFRFSTHLPLFLKNIKAFKPDVIHVHSPMSVGIEGALVAERLKLPAVQTFHTYYMDTEMMKLIGIRNKNLAEFIQNGGWRFHRAFSRLFEVTTAPTKFVEQDLINQETPGTIMYVPNILPAQYFAPHPRQNKRAKKFMYVGRQSPEKRIDLVMRSFALALQQYPDIELHLIGSGPARDELFQLSFDLGISQAIRWYGNIDHKKLIAGRYYQEADIFVTSSRFETFGYTTLESMAHQVPVIALASRGNSEVIQKAGFLIPDTEDPDEAVKNLAKTMIKTQDIDLDLWRKKAYEQAKKYAPETLLPLYEKAYTTAIEKHKVYTTV